MTLIKPTTGRKAGRPSASVTRAATAAECRFVLSAEERSAVVRALRAGDGLTIREWEDVGERVREAVLWAKEVMDKREAR